MKILNFLFSLIAIIAVFCSSTTCKSSAAENNAALLTLSFFSTNNEPTHFIVVEKSTQKLMVFEQGQSLKLLKTFGCATGENPGKKSINGDSKTPEGIYFITEIYEDKKITVFGSRAYHLDYPNVFDKHAGHLGNGIFIHGTNKTLIPFSTNGCITLTNKDLDDLAPFLTVNALPIIILEKLSAPLIDSKFIIDKNDITFSEILKELSLSFDDFAEDNIDTISFITFDSQAISSINYRLYGGNSVEYRYEKRVYLTAGVSKDWRTLYSVENLKTAPTLLATKPIKNQLVETPPPTVASQMDMGPELLDFVKKWQSAWSNKDIDTYIECYSPSFRNGRLDRNGWKNKKSYLNRKYSFIKVDIRNIVIEWTEAGADVSFFQQYQSDQYQTSGNKRLQLVNRDNRWMIQKEIM